MIHLFLKTTEEKESQTAHALLRQVLRDVYGMEKPLLQISQQGKPYLPHGPEFNISHSRGYIAVAFSDMPVGVDLEAIRSFSPMLPERVFSDSELLWFRGRGGTQRDFFTLWTLKESYYKFLGAGLPGFPNKTEFYQDEAGAWKMADSGLNFCVMEEENLSLALCSQREIQLTIHRV